MTTKRMKDPRTRHFKMRLSQAEYDLLQDICERVGTSSADLVRTLVFGPECAQRIPNERLLHEIMIELKRIGHNINQSTRALNTANLQGTLSADDAAAFVEVLKEAEQAYQAPRRQIAKAMESLKR